MNFICMGTEKWLYQQALFVILWAITNDYSYHWPPEYLPGDPLCLLAKGLTSGEKGTNKITHSIR